MKRGNELGIKPIQSNNIASTGKIRDIHIEVNELLYKYSLRYISRLDAEAILARLTELGKKLNDTVPGDKGKERKELLLNETRNIWRNVNEYHKNFQWTDGDIEQIEATKRFLIAKLIKAKKDRSMEERPADFLEEIHEFYVNMVRDSACWDKVKLDSLIDFNEDLLTVLQMRYNIRQSYGYTSHS